MKYSNTSRIHQMMLSLLRNAFLPACILLVATATGQVQSVLPADNKEMIISEKYQQVQVHGEVTIVLTNDPAGQLQFEGDARDIASVSTSVKKGKLVILADKKVTFSTLVVRVPVTGIMSLVVNGNAEIFSAGRIKIQKLEIMLNGAAFLAITYEGKLKVFPGIGYEVTDAAGYAVRDSGQVTPGVR